MPDTRVCDRFHSAADADEIVALIEFAFCANNDKMLTIRSDELKIYLGKVRKGEEKEGRKRI